MKSFVKLLARRRALSAALLTFCLLNLPFSGSFTNAATTDEHPTATSALNIIDDEQLGARLWSINGKVRPLTGFLDEFETSEFKNHIVPAYDQRIRQYSAAGQYGNYDYRLSLLRELRSLCPDDLRIPWYYAGILEELQRYAEAGEEYARLKQRFVEPDAVSKFGRNNTNECKSYLTSKEAHCYQLRGDFNTALAKYLQATEADTNRASALYGVAQCQEALGAQAAARDTYLRVMSQFPTSSYASASRDNILALEKASREDLSEADHHGCWDFSKPITVYIDSGKDCTFYEPYMRDAVIDSLREWSDASGGRMQFQILPPSPLESASVANYEAANGDVLKFQDPINCNIHVIWTDVVRGAHTLGITWPVYPKKNSLMDKKYVAIATLLNAGGIAKMGNDQAIADAKKARKRSMYFTILHEMGHALGLGHLSDSGAVMFYAVFGGLSEDSAGGFLHLTNKDVRALEKHYDNFNPNLVEGLEKSDLAAHYGIKRSKRVSIPSAVSASGTALAPSKIYGGANIGNYVPFANKNSGTEFASSLAASTPTSFSSAASVPQPAPSKAQNVLVLIGKGDYAAALKLSDQVMASKPKDAEMLYLRAICFTKLKNYKEARVAYEQVIKLSPDSKTGSLARKGLEKLNGESL